MSTRETEIRNLQKDWAENARWQGIKRAYSAEDVIRLRGSVAVEHTLARRGSTRLWELLHSEPFVNSLGALTGNQAMQQVKAGLKAIYLSGWQVAGDANLAGEMYPDQSLYPANSVPQVVRRINNSLTRCDQVQWMEGKNPGDEGYIDYFCAHRGGRRSRLRRRAQRLRTDEGHDRSGRLGRALRRPAGLGQEVRPHGRQVLVPTREAVSKLVSARLAADVMGTPTVLLARTDADAADLVTSDVDDNDRPFITGERAPWKASSAPAPASTRRSRAAWPMRPMPI